MISLDELTFLFGQAESLPELPDSPLKLAQLIESGNPNQSQIESIIHSDPALTAGIIKAASSALFARAKPITTVREATTVLGYRSLRALAIACWTNSLTQITANRSELTPKRFAANANTVAHLAATIHKAQPTKGDWNNEEILAAGTLHNVLFGLLAYVDAETFNKIYNGSKQNQISLDQGFQSCYNTPISALAPRAASALGLPTFFIESVSTVSTPWDQQNQSQACLTTAKLIADTKNFGLGDWEVLTNETPISLSEAEVEPLLIEATHKPALLAAA